MKHTLISLTICMSFTSSTWADAGISQQWALGYLKADEVWQISKGDGVVVAIVDSGAQPNSDLSTNLLSGADFTDGSGQSTGDGHTDTDSFGHGTGVSALVGGSGAANDSLGTEGLAPAASLLPLRASTTNGEGLAFGAAPAITFAVTHNARVINLSVAGTLDDPSIHTAVQYALDHDVVVVAGVGNDGNDTQVFPAAYPGVIGVGAIDSSGTVWSKSNFGPDVSLVAPGVHIYRDDNQGRQGYSDGTSYSTAYVSAAAALVRSAHPTWSAPQVVAALTSTADRPAAMRGAVRDDHYGYGILDVLAAVRLSSPPSVVSPVASSSAEGGGASPTQGVATPAGSVGPRDRNSATAVLVGGGALILAAVGIGGYSVRRGRRRGH